MSHSLDDKDERYLPESIDLGEGYTLSWIGFQGEIIGGVIEHPLGDGKCAGSFWLPNSTIFFVDTGVHRPVWKMTGNYEKPTLSPSFLCHCGESHGFVREGKWCPV